MTRLRLILIITLIPEILVLGFFIFARIQSPPSLGRSIAAQLDIPHPAIIGHRGAPYLAPEETRASYLLARDLGVDYLEADVQRTKDGVLILIHDETLERTTNVASVFPGREKQTVGQFTFAELSKLDAGSSFNARYPDRARDRYKGLRILSLDEMIGIAESGSQWPGLYLETKSPELYPGIENDLVTLLKKRGWIGVGKKCADTSVLADEEPESRKVVRVACGRAKLIFQSFSAESLRVLRELAPEVPRVYLVDEEMEKKQGWKKINDDATRIEAGLGPVGYLAWPWYAGPAHRQGRLLHYYTINTRWQLWLLSQFGADGFFTDRAELALEYFGRLTKPDVNRMIEELVF